MATEALRATQAARRLGMSTKEVIRLALENKIRFVMVDGMVHFPEDALDDFQAKAS